ncbi:plasmid maintenance system killer protein [Levilactobacillus lanxiensis]|uniref:Plasmid maintenance system killer protein n=2 Tax=Levilactobacillus lanxiensis TaxID=2799568 RepID=A0ABW4D2F0_9LACO|nr:plasmid maintenance system killer protein [Levilactobacillus lanxiensis]
MELDFESHKLGKIFNTHVSMVKRFGPLIAHGVEKRLAEIQSAERLSQISHLPPARLHLLLGDLQDFYAVSVTSNVRLVFYGLDMYGKQIVDKERITKIVITKVSDYHDK